LTSPDRTRERRLRARSRRAGQEVDRDGPGIGQSRRRLVLRSGVERGTLSRMTTTITLQPDDLDRFRLMLREQLAGDHELMRDLLHDREDEAAIAVDYRVPETAARIALVDRLAVEVGGLY